MLHHVSFAADQPQQVAQILARLLGGHVGGFGPLADAAVVWAGDGAGTAIEIYPTGTEIWPDPAGGQAQFGHNALAQGPTATHASISVDRTEDEILDVAREAGWQAATLDRGGFDVIELWVENRVMLEVLTPAMLARYLAAVNAPQIAASGTDFDPLTLSVRVATDAATAWTGWTSAAELRRWWPVRSARIDLRVGGAFELTFLPEGAADARGADHCRVLSYVPDRMLSFTWSTPPHLPVPRTHTWVVVTFTDVAGGTEVELVHNGIPAGPGWDECREYFRHAWRRVLRHMVDHWQVTDLTSRSRVTTSS